MNDELRKSLDDVMEEIESIEKMDIKKFNG